MPLVKCTFDWTTFFCSFKNCSQSCWWSSRAQVQGLRAMCNRKRGLFVMCVGQYTEEDRFCKFLSRATKCLSCVTIAKQRRLYYFNVGVSELNPTTLQSFQSGIYSTVSSKSIRLPFFDRHPSRKCDLKRRLEKDMGVNVGIYVKGTLAFKSNFQPNFYSHPCGRCFKRGGTVQGTGLQTLLKIAAKCSSIWRFLEYLLMISIVFKLFFKIVVFEIKNEMV